MSVFSKIKFAKKAAKEHKGKAAAEKDSNGQEVVKKPYKHVPTHAAVDALSGAPSSWKAEDKPKIKEHHKRRSQMTTSRTTSSLSAIASNVEASSPSSSAPTPPLLHAHSYSVRSLPRNSSYDSYSPTWNDRGDRSYMAEPVSKRQKPSRNHSYRDSAIGPSPLASNVASEEVSEVGSSADSTSSTASSEKLEMKDRSTANVYAEKDIFKNLHTSTTRKLGEAPISGYPQYSQTPKKTPAAAVVAQEQQEKKKQARWSFKGKRNTMPAIAV